MAQAAAHTMWTPGSHWVRHKQLGTSHCRPQAQWNHNAGAFDCCVLTDGRMVRLQAAEGTSSRPSSLVAVRSCRTCHMWLCREATRGLCSTSMATRHRCLAMSRCVQQLLQPVAICLQVTGDLQQQVHHACCKQAVPACCPLHDGARRCGHTWCCRRGQRVAPPPAKQQPSG